MVTIWNNIIRLGITALCILWTSGAIAQSVNGEWARSIHSTGNEQVNDIVADRSTNDIYVVGQWDTDLSTIFPAGVNIATDFNNTFGQVDGFVAKYDQDGNVLWSFKLGGPDDDIVKSIALDEAGNIYITGYFGTGTCYFPGTSPDTAPARLDNTSMIDFYIAKYDSEGRFQWVRRSSTDFGDLAGLDLYANSTAVYATGRANNWAMFGPLNMSNTPNGDDIFLIKYSLDGTEQWVAECGSNGDEYAEGVIADDNFVYFTGSFDGSNLNLRNAPGGNAASLSNANNGTEDIVIACYDSSGNHSWSRSISGSGKENAIDITMDADSIYLTGAVDDNAAFPGYPGNPVSTSFHRDVFLSSHAKSNGNTGWVEVIPSTHTGPKAQIGRSIDIDGNGILYLSGDFDDDLIFPDSDTITTVEKDDVFAASFSSEGSFIWATSAGSTGDDDSRGIAVGSEGTLYIGGKYSDLISLDTLTLPDDAGANGFVAKLGYNHPVPNDNPCSAIQLAVGDTCNEGIYDNNDATDSGIPDPGCGDYSGGDVWFKAVVPPSGNLFIGTNTSRDETHPAMNGWMYQVALAVYSGTCNSLTLEGCYSYNGASHYRTSSAYLLDRTPGDTIWMRVWEGLNDDIGKFNICTYDPTHFPAWDIPETLCLGSGPIDLDTTLSEPRTGFADEVIGSSGVVDPINAEGDPDGLFAGINQDGDWINLDLGDTIPPGETYEIHFRSHPPTPGTTQMTLKVSDDNISYYTHSYKPETELDNFTAYYITAEHPTRYILIENINAGAGGFGLDGIRYTFWGTKGGTWSGPGVTGSLFDPSGLSGPVPITYTVGGSNTETDSTNIITISNSFAGILRGDTSVCYNNEDVVLELNNSNGKVLKWESSEDGFSTITSIPLSDSVLTVSNPSQTTQYRVIVQDGSCEPDTSNSINITVHPPSTVHLSGDTIICNGLSTPLIFELTGISPWELEFENDFDTLLISGITESSYSYSVSPSLITDYSIISMHDGNGCPGTFSGSARVEPIPIANPGKDSAVCGNTFQFEALPGSGTGIWSKTTGPGTVLYTPDSGSWDAEVSVDNYGSYEFTWTETDGSCLDDSTITIDFYEPPLADAGPGSEVCGLTTGLQANPSTGVGTWTFKEGPGNIVITPDEHDPVARITVDQPGKYELLWTENNGPCSEDTSIILVFHEIPVANAGAGGEVCGLDFKLDAVPSTGKGTWSQVSGPGTSSFLPGDTVNNPMLNVDVYGAYEYRWTETNGLCSSYTSITVNFLEPPLAEASSGGDQCGLSFQLNAMPGVGTGEWSLVSGPGQATFESGVTAAKTIVHVEAYGSYMFMWTIRNGSCSDSIYVNVNFYDIVTVDAGPEGNPCGLTFDLAASPVTGSGNWDIVRGPGKAIFSPSDTSANAAVTVEEYGTYEFRWSISITDCGGSDNVLVHFHEQPVADAGPDQVLESEFTTNFRAGMPADGTGKWQVISGTGQIRDENDPASEVYGLSVDENEFSWTITSNYCPDVSDNVLISVHDMGTQTVITPNNDGLNDVLVFQEIENLPGSEIEIYTRWGTRVYNNGNYENDWDGRDHKNRELPPDTYYYVLKISDGRLIKGFVEIRK